MQKELIQCIVISEDVNYKKKVKEFLEKNISEVDIKIVDDLYQALAFMNDKPPFKVLIRKHNKPLSTDEIENCSRAISKDVNFRILIFQEKHKDMIMMLNLSSIRYLKEVLNVFKNLKTKAVIKGLSGN